jgi:hypothetical protein
MKNSPFHTSEKTPFRTTVKTAYHAQLMVWEVGKYIGSVMLGGERAAYGKQIVTELASQLRWSRFS